MGSEWTIESLRMYLIALMTEIDRRHEERLTAHETSFRDAFTALDRMLEVARDAHAAWADQRIDDLRNLLDERNSTQQTALHTALASIEKAVDKAEEAVNKRFESVNEFRAQLAEQQATYITRTEVNAKVDAVHTELTGITNRNIERIQETADRVNKIDGKGDGGLAARAAILTVISTIVAVISVTLTLYIAAHR